MSSQDLDLVEECMLALDAGSPGERLVALGRLNALAEQLAEEARLIEHILNAYRVGLRHGDRSPTRLITPHQPQPPRHFHPDRKKIPPPKPQ